MDKAVRAAPSESAKAVRRCQCPRRLKRAVYGSADDVRSFHPDNSAPRAHVAMALSELSGDEQGILFVQLSNVLDPGFAVALASVSNELRAATRVPLEQLRTDHKAAAALCRKLGHRRPGLGGDEQAGSKRRGWLWKRSGALR